MLHGAALLVPGTASLPHRTGRGPTASLLVAYYAARLSVTFHTLHPCNRALTMIVIKDLNQICKSSIQIQRAELIPIFI
jgi:hypothetical protein